MKIGKLNSRIQRLGSKTAGDISRAVGKTNKVIKQVEKGVNKGIGEVSKVADSAVVRGIQQGTGIASKALLASGVPQAQALGAGLGAVHQGIKNARKAIPDKVSKAQGKVSGLSGKLQSEVSSTATKANALVREGQAKAGNVLEKAPPKEDGWSELPMYVD